MKETEYYSERKKGIIGTIVFHAIALIILLFLGFFTPLPLPGEEGILVNFGDSETGLGEQEPSPAARKEPAPTPAPAKREEQAVSQPATTPPKTVSTPKSQPAKEVVMTQDYEKTVAINAANEKKREEEKKRQDQLAEARKKQQAEDAEKKRIEEADRKRIAEAERVKREEAEKQAKAEAERKAREEAERKRVEEEQRKINEINSRTQGAFANKSGTGTGGTGSGTGTSQGVTFPGGNQGVPTGDPNAGKYGPGGSGSGNQGSGPSFSLAGRSAVSLPKPKYPGNDSGVVVVKITVDKNGNVTSAEPGAQGSTIMDQRFWNEAKQAALKARFNVSENAQAYQQGTITYRFVLD